MPAPSAASVVADAEARAALAEWRRTHPKQPNPTISNAERSNADQRLACAFRARRASRLEFGANLSVEYHP